jgi:hypothetical protein
MEAKRSQEYPSFGFSKFTINRTPGNCIIVISFDEWGWDICLKNDAATGTSIS